MARYRDENGTLSRRIFLKKMRWAPVLFLPAPIHAASSWPFRGAIPGGHNFAFDLADNRVFPHYPAKSPLEAMLRKADQGSDEYATEKYAFEIMRPLEDWSRALKQRTPALGVLAECLDTSLQASSLVPTQDTTLRSGGGIHVVRRKFAAGVTLGRERFLP